MNRETGMSDAPDYDCDFYGDDFIRNPQPHYAAMRKLGAVVYLPRLGNHAVVQYSAVREALRNVGVYRSGDGVAGDDVGCRFLRGNTLASDPPLHDQLRRAMGEPLLPLALEQHRAWIEAAAEELIDALCVRRRFDGMLDLARYLPMTIVTKLVGLPEDGRDNMLKWAAASFDILGVQNERGRSGMECIKEMRQWIADRATPDTLRPGSWTARIFDLSGRGELPAALVPQLIRDYINPSLDTTISATGELIYQLGQCPDQWDLIRQDQSLIHRAIEEAVRLASPIRSFTRTVASDHSLGGVELKAGSRVMLVFASANRDESRFTDPDRFDVHRAPIAHLGFGHGIHMCVGMNLARLEMQALLAAMVPRVRRLHVGQPSITLNNTIRSYSRLPVTLEAEIPLCPRRDQSPIEPRPP
jgi:cytochrome P450